MRTPMIVVGVDGSSPSERAVRWAVLEAGRRSVELAVVSAYRGRLSERRVVREPEFAEDVRDLALVVDLTGVEPEDVNIERRDSDELRITGRYRECAGTLRRRSRRIEGGGRSVAGQVQAAEGAPGQQATGPETAGA